MKYMIREKVEHYHEIDIDDELDMEQILSQVESIGIKFDNALEGIDYILNKYQKEYNKNYTIKPNACGQETVSVEIIDELD